MAKKLKETSIVGNRSPSTTEATYIETMSKQLSEQSELDQDWIKKTLYATLPEDSDDSKFIFALHIPAATLYRFKPCLFEAMRSLPAEDVFNLFSGDLEQLKIQEERFSTLLEEIPFVSFDSILPIAKEFREYLEQETKSLIETGYPSRPFEKSFYLERTFLSNFSERLVFSTDVSDESYIRRREEFKDTALSNDYLREALGPRYFRDQKEYLWDLTALDWESQQNLKSRIKRIQEQQRISGYHPLNALKQYLKTNKLKVPADIDKLEESFRTSIHAFAKGALEEFCNAYYAKKPERLMHKIWEAVCLIPHEHLDLLFNGNLSCFGIEYEIDQPNLYTHGRATIEKILVAAAIATESARTGKIEEIKKTIGPVIDEFKDPQTKEIHPITFSLYQAIYCCSHDAVTDACGELAVIKTHLQDLKSGVEKGVNQAIEISYKRLQEMKKDFAKLEYMRVLALDGSNTSALDETISPPDASDRVRFSEDFGEYRPVHPGYKDPFQFSSGRKKAAIKTLLNAYHSGDQKVSVDILIDSILGKGKDEVMMNESTWRLERDVFRLTDDAIRYGMIRSGAKKNGKRSYLLDFSFSKKHPDEVLREIEEQKSKKKETAKAEKQKKEARKKSESDASARSSNHPFNQSYGKPKKKTTSMLDRYKDDDDE